MYKQVISLGFFCSVAIELEHMNLRSKSGPFDWTITSIEGLIGVIQDGFKDFLNPAYLVQDKEYPYIIKNTKYHIHFYHDFNLEEPFEMQLPRVREKYARRIRHFYEDVTQPTLFVRYIEDQEEYDRICQEYTNILYLFKQFNPRNEVCWIANSDLRFSNHAGFYVYTVEKDPNDLVARNFLEKNSWLAHSWQLPIISPSQREKNRVWKQAKNK